MGRVQCAFLREGFGGWHRAGELGVEHQRLAEEGEIQWHRFFHGVRQWSEAQTRLLDPP